MGKSDLWNLQALNGVPYAPKPGDVTVNIPPDDIAASFDGGSGKFKIAFFQISGSSYKPFFEDEIDAGIAADTYIGHRSLNLEGMRKVLLDLPKFRNHIEASGTSNVYAYTTGAVRYWLMEAPDICEEFVEQAENLLGYTLKNVSGEFEAGLVLMGGKAMHPNINALVVGKGGSTMEGGILEEDGLYSHAVETGLGSHTSVAELKAHPDRTYAEILERELKPFEMLFAAAKDKPFIPTGSIFRRNTRLLMRDAGLKIPLYVPFVPNIVLPRAEVMPRLEQWGSMTPQQFVAQLQPPLDPDERKIWKRKIEAYAERMPCAMQDMHEIMQRGHCSSIMSSSASTRAGVVYAIRNNIDISEIASRPVSSKPPACPERLTQAALA